MKASVRYWFILLFILLIAEVIVVGPDLLGEREADDAKPFSEANKAATQKMEKVHLIETTDGAREWDLRAETAITYQNTEDWLIEGVNATFFGRDELNTVVTGERGIVKVGSKDVEISGDVKVVSSNGYEFRSQRVNYNSRERVLLSDTPVTMQSESKTQKKKTPTQETNLTGGGMRLDLNSGIIQLHTPVKGRMQMANELPAELSSETAEFSAKSYMATFLGQVLIQYKALQVRGPKAVFNYDKEKQDLRSIDFLGGVKVSDVDKWARAQHLRIFTDEDRLVLRGQPKVVQDNDELRGDEIIFLDGGNEVRVEKGRARIEEVQFKKVN